MDLLKAPSPHKLTEGWIATVRRLDTISCSRAWKERRLVSLSDSSLLKDLDRHDQNPEVQICNGVECCDKQQHSTMIEDSSGLQESAADAFGGYYESIIRG